VVDRNKQIVLVTGATGAVGPVVVHALYDAGYAIRTLSIDPPPAGRWADDIDTRVGDVTDASVVQSSIQDVDAVVHMAALLHIVNPPLELRKKYECINIGGTATVVEAAIKAGVKRIVLFSTIAVYGPSHGFVLDEQTPTQPDSFYAQTKCAAEQIVLDAKDEKGQRLGTVLRLGAVYGPRIKGNYERLSHALARYRFIPIGKGLNRRTLVYDKDVGRAVVLAVSHPRAEGQIFNVTDGEYHALNDIIQCICSALGRKPPSFSLSAGLSRILGGGIEKGCHLLGLNPPAVRAMIDKYTEDIAVDGTFIQKELGFVPRYNLKSGWKETIKELKQTGNL
jgi:nucleoside-diphosphate-sugar epimerase